MPEHRPLVPLLRALERELEQEHISTSADRRIARALRERCEPPPARRRWLPMATFAAGAALVVAVLGRPDRPPPVSSDVAASPPRAASVGAFEVHGQGCRREGARTRTHLDGDCRLVTRAVVVQTWAPVEIATDGPELRVLAGEALFDVAKVHPGDPPVRVRVSHGSIEVVGTRFLVHQGADGGHVDLFEGRIRFHDRDGRTTEVEPGQRRAWGDQAQAEPSEAADDAPATVDSHDDAPARRAPRRPRPEDATEIIEQVGALRAERRFAEAARVLRRALRRRWDRRTAQVLSYELAELLRELGDRAEACRHLEAHQARYAGGRYDTAVREAQAALGCEP